MRELEESAQRMGFLQDDEYPAGEGSTMALEVADDESSHSDNFLHDMIVDDRSTADQDVALEALLIPKTEQTAHRGWVLDRDTASKRSKLLTRSTGGFLGFRDWKKAYYGVPQSGSLQLFVTVGESRSIDFLRVCEDDSPAKSSASCLLDRDVAFWILLAMWWPRPLESKLVSNLKPHPTWSFLSDNLRANPPRRILHNSECI